MKTENVKTGGGEGGRVSVRVVDMFCGAGGTITGMMRAGRRMGREVDLTAVNHDLVACNSLRVNHPSARVLCQSLDNLDPRRVCPGRLDILCASPECTNHVRAKGNRPLDEQSRAGAWHVVTWVAAKRPGEFLVENVTEFLDYGPLDRRGRPIPSRKGETFKAWINALESMGYVVEWRILCAADFGDPTSRERLFVRGRLGARAPVWPDGGRRWRAASGVIDWGLRGQSIFGRPKPLVPNTLKRIWYGIQKFNGAPFIVRLRGTSLAHLKSSALGMDEPVPTISAGGTHLGLCQPFLVKYYGTGGGAVSLDDPMDTITTVDRFGLVLPEIRSGEGDIVYRMLQPHELKVAMGFPRDYVFTGTRREQIRQIGNAVAVNTAEALCRAMISGDERSFSA